MASFGLKAVRYASGFDCGFRFHSGLRFCVGDPATVAAVGCEP